MTEDCGGTFVLAGEDVRKLGSSDGGATFDKDTTVMNKMKYCFSESKQPQVFSNNNEN